MKDKIELEGFLNAPIFRKKEQERISGKEIKIPSNYEKIVGNGIIKSEDIPAPDFSGAELQNLRAKIIELSQENESLKAALEYATPDKFKKKLSELKAENESLKADLKELLDNQEVADGSSSDNTEE